MPQYIERRLYAHAWDTPKSKQTKSPSPLPDSCLKTIIQECGFYEGTVDAYKLELAQGFGQKNMLMGPTLNIKHTTHDSTIHQTTFKRQQILILRMVDDCLILCDHEATTWENFSLFGLAL